MNIFLLKDEWGKNPRTKVSTLRAVPYCSCGILSKMAVLVAMEKIMGQAHDYSVFTLGSALVENSTPWASFIMSILQVRIQG